MKTIARKCKAAWLAAMLFGAALLFSLTAFANGAAMEIYVDPVNGSDNGAGTYQSPVKTITQARDKVRTVNQGMNGDIIVYLRGGNYELAEPLQFTAADSGNNGHNVIWKAYNGEKPFVRGPRVITGWTLHDPERQIYKADAGGPIETRQLYVNGERAVRARSHAGLANATTDTGQFGHTSTDTFLASWNNISDMEMVYVQNWTMPRVGVDSITVGADGLAYIKMKQPGWASATNKGMTSVKLPWYYENAYELLDEPGEWYLDRSTDTFYYMPRAGEDLAHAEVVAPVLEQLMSVSGSDFSHPVRNITFDGISFGYSTYLRPNGPYGNVDAQNNHTRDSVSDDLLPPAAVMVQYGDGISFVNCEFSKIGINALQLIDGIRNATVDGNRFYDISASAINLGEPYTKDVNNYNPSEDKYLIKNNAITNNYIHDVAKEYMSASALSVGFPQDTVIEHNEIFHVPYSGMHIGYGWKSIPVSAIKNLHIRHNYIHDIFYTELHDGGGIYTIGPTSATAYAPNQIAYNYITDMNNDGGPIYNDQGSNFYTSYRNVIDQSRAKTWVSGTPKWFKGWGKDIQQATAIENYTNISHIVSDGAYDGFVYGTRYVPNSDWPEEALEIIEQSGLEPAYRQMAQVPQELTATRTFLSLQSGGTEQIGLNALTSKRVPFDLSVAQVVYQAVDEAVAVVSPGGLLTAVGPGQTAVDVMVRYRDITLRTRVEVTVDDPPYELLATAGRNVLMPGDSLTLALEGRSVSGQPLEVSQAAYTSDHPGIASVDGNGVITGAAEGSTVIRISAVCGGQVLAGSFPVRVVLHAASAPAVYTPYQLDSVIDAIYGWHVQGSGTKTAGPDSIVFDTPGGSANYQGQVFGDEIFDFNVNIVSTPSGWPSFQFRGESSTKTVNEVGNAGYIIVVKPTEIELQRFNNGVRTVIFGNLAGNPSIAGRAYPNNILSYGQTARIQCGAVNGPDGVRLIFTVNGVRVFDYLDTGENRITAPGYFGIVSRSGTMTLSKVQEEQELRAAAAVPEQLPVTAPLLPKRAEQVTAAAADGQPVVLQTSVELTRLEFLTAVFGWMKTTTDSIWYQHSSPWGSPPDQERIKTRQALYASVVQAQGTADWEAKVKSAAMLENLLDSGMFSGSTINLQAKVTRQEAASISYRAYNRMTAEYVIGQTAPYTDQTEIAPWARDAVRMVDVLGYMEADSANRFRPKANLTKTESDVIIGKMRDTVKIR
ncbi:MAG: hypothetical protein K0R57_4113 [Paenibacillaceae bacterium]|nr:hypothetical protein [Paenibacillaceae bacterium]